MRTNPSSPASYVVAAIELMEKHSVRRKSINWTKFRETAIAEAQAATTIAECYPVIRAALRRLGDGHSLFLTPAEWDSLSGGSAQPGATASPSPKVERWDGALESNVAKISGESYRLFQINPAVAVLTGPRTASSGEAVAVAFRGRPRTRSFGTPTCGMSTGNDVFPLSDRAAMFLTTCIMADRLGRSYGGAIRPDQDIAGATAQSHGQDPVIQAALAWLRTA
jgi:hypothetical protein